MSRFRRVYGASPLHLVLVLCSFALTGYAGIRLLAGAEPWKVVLWFVGAALLHDLVFLPLYTVTDRGARMLLGMRRKPVATSHAARPTQGRINYVRVPVFLSGVLLLTYFPLILGRVSHRFTLYTTLSTDVYLGRWLLITAVFFALSALALLFRTARSRPTQNPGVGRSAAPRPEQGNRDPGDGTAR
ncbi:hypothetical protein OG473_03735 [Streptomyces anulatus]|uniref:hypothetical protein n=1 Tax=Streptomyces anulatus TaxID=1892 RepID=UPI00324B65FB|nr:hypothetical protein OG238_39085 [Streptomyces anulatus]WSU33683.1 hypothetical protein OG391_37140 [Streptomyces anulatus]WSU87397.1 hypothetical protein OG575_01485 [Streptomyces anulatus]